MVASLLAAVAACRPQPEESQPPLRARPALPAAALAVRMDEALADQLAELEAALTSVTAAESPAELASRMLLAEAMTDRLLEQRPPGEWLEEGYSVEARLRQLQTHADLIVALLRRGAAREEVAEDVAQLLGRVTDLRGSIAEERLTPAPTPLDSLLQDSAAYRRGLQDAWRLRAEAEARGGLPPTRSGIPSPPASALPSASRHPEPARDDTATAPPPPPVTGEGVTGDTLAPPPPEAR